VRDFRLDLVLAVEGSLRAEAADGFVDAIVGSVIIYSVMCTPESQHSHFLLHPFSLVNDRSAVPVTMMYMLLITFPARVQQDDEVMEHCLS